MLFSKKDESALSWKVLKSVNLLMVFILLGSNNIDHQFSNLKNIILGHILLKTFLVNRVCEYDYFPKNR